MIRVKAIVLHGSPRRGKNSDTLAEEFLRGFAETGAHVVQHFFLNEMNIKPCQGCLHCATSPRHQCFIEDDMTLIYNAYKEADLIVWASPMYWGYITAQMKTVQDRMEALAWEGFDGKVFVVLLTYRYHYESAANMFRRIAPYFHIDLHVVLCQTYDVVGKRDLSICECSEGLKEAFELGKTIGMRAES
jgi:multimeric flavodoxin WrbA